MTGATSAALAVRARALLAAVRTLPARLSWSGGGVLHRIGWSGVAGMLLGAAGIAALLFAGLHLEPAVQSDRDQLARVIAEQRDRPGAATELPASPTQRLEAFYGGFPAVADIPAGLGRLVKLAAADGLALEQGQYRLAAEAAGPLLRYEMKLPVRGTYRQVRRFVEAALVDAPYLALDRIEFRREAVGDAALEASVEFSLYVRTP